MSNSMKYIDLAFDSLEVETEMAFCFVDGDCGRVWIPRSQIERDDEGNLLLEIKRDGTVEVSITEWVAKQKGLI